MRNHAVLVALALLTAPLLAGAACAPPVYLPEGFDADDDDGRGDDDDGDGDGNGDGSGSGSGSGPAGCDDPNTCEYDLETTCAGTPRAAPESFPACPQSICASGGHCVPSAAVPSDQLGMLASCGGSDVCVPDTFIERGGLLTAPSCTSIAGAEGRCLSTCLPAVADQAELLPSTGCGASEVCVPCFDVFDGSATGACEISCDPGPVAQAKVLPACCQEDGGGTCVPTTLLDGAETDRLDDEECADLGMADAVCVPNVLLNAHLVGVPWSPVECETGPLVQSLGLGSEGGCLPECIPIVGILPVTRQNCASGYKCVPCIDLTGDGTGACSPQ